METDRVKFKKDILKEFSNIKDRRLQRLTRIKIDKLMTSDTEYLPYINDVEEVENWKNHYLARVNQNIRVLFSIQDNEITLKNIINLKDLNKNISVQNSDGKIITEVKRLIKIFKADKSTKT